jgi:hypothetical protein
MHTPAACSQVMQATPDDQGPGVPQAPLDSTLASTTGGQGTLGATGGKGGPEVVSSVDATGGCRRVCVREGQPERVVVDQMCMMVTVRVEAWCALGTGWQQCPW